MKKILHKILGKLAYFYRYILFEKYRKKYHFNQWHMIPKIMKPYVIDIIHYIEKTSVHKGTSIVECGCGLCDILSAKCFSKCNRVGVERDKRVFDAIQEIYAKKGIKFVNGSFQDILNMDIDWLIAVNFTHEISDADMAAYLNNLTEKNHIKYFILDEVTGNYKYTHDYAAILTEGGMSHAIY